MIAKTHYINVIFKLRFNKRVPSHGVDSKEWVDIGNTIRAPCAACVGTRDPARALPVRLGEADLLSVKRTVTVGEADSKINKCE